MRDDGTMVRVALVEPLDMIRAGLRHFLTAPQIGIVAECSTLADGLATVHRLEPDVVLMEMNMSDGCSLQACRDIRSARPATRVIFLATANSDEAKLSAILAGADGVLPKNIDAATLTSAVLAVGAGQSIVDQDIVRILVNRLQSQPQRTSAGKPLSSQERRILGLVAEGKTNKEIGESLSLSHKTVKNYLSNVYQKLQITRRSQAAAIYARMNRE